MYQNKFLESRKFHKIHLENPAPYQSLHLAPFINEGGSIFKKDALFLEALTIGNSSKELPGTIAFRDDGFWGYDGSNWKNFMKETHWRNEDGILFCLNNKVGINKVNPKKMLEIGGDTQVDKKLYVKEQGIFDEGIILNENEGKKKKGLIRFYNGEFEGFNGEQWINFGKILKREDVKPEIESFNYEIMKPLIFKNNEYETHFFYENGFKFQKLHSKSFEPIAFENIECSGITVHNNIDCNKHKIINVSDPLYQTDVATKKYVDQVAQGLNNYLVCHYLYLSGDEVKENILEGEFVVFENLELKKKIGDELVLIKHVEIPAKVLVKKGKYSNSEYFILDEGDTVTFLQVNGIESVEYGEGMKKEGNIVNLVIDEKIKGLIREKFEQEEILEERHFRDNLISGRNIKDGEITGRHLRENTIDGKHLKQGFLKNTHFSPGIITEKEISSESISERCLKPNIIKPYHLDKEVVGEEQLKMKIIRSGHLNDKIIDSHHLKSSIILGEHLESNQLESRHLKEGVIKTQHLELGIIGEKQLRDKVIFENHLTPNIISNLHLMENAVSSINIKEQSVKSIHLERDVIKDWHLDEKIIEGKHLKEGIIEGRMIQDRSIGANHLIKNFITGDLIKSNEIKERHLGFNLINTEHLINCAVITSKIMDNAITEGKISNNAVSTNKVKNGAITNEKLKNSFIKVLSDTVLTCNQEVNLGETLSININPNYFIPKKKDGFVEVLDNVKLGEEETPNQLEVNLRTTFKNQSIFQGDVKFNGKVEFKKEMFYSMGMMMQCLFFPKDLDESKWLKCDGREIRKQDYYDFFYEQNLENETLTLPNLPMTYIKISF